MKTKQLKDSYIASLGEVFRLHSQLHLLKEASIPGMIDLEVGDMNDLGEAPIDDY